MNEPNLRDVIKKSIRYWEKGDTNTTLTLAEEFRFEALIRNRIYQHYLWLIEDRKRQIKNRLQDLEGQPELLYMFKESLSEDYFLLGYEKEADKALADLLRAQKTISNVIHSVDDLDQHDILCDRYLDCKSWEEIAEKTLSTVEELKKTHQAGVLEVEKILNKALQDCEGISS